MENNHHKILIVDDNSKNVQILANLLSEKGYVIEYALNGLDALKLVALEDFDLILLDIMMPVMDGFEVCKKIKSDQKKREIPIIFLTAKTDTENLQRAFEYGGEDYVNKPFGANELLSRVKAHIEIKKSRDKLKEVNKYLEEKVAERTVELERANKKLLELDHSKSQFLQIISHEIKTPLNGMNGALSLINELDFTKESIGYLNILKRSTDRLEKFSITALDISRLNTYGEKALTLEKANIKKTVSIVLDKIEHARNVKKINILQTINLDNEFAIVDVQHLSKCLDCILDNAIKYSPYNGSVLVNVLNDCNNLVLEIKDEGSGFEKNVDIDSLEPFENENHIDKNPGLGLILSNLIVKAHGGTIENGNNEDKGAFVRMVLPIN